MAQPIVPGGDLENQDNEGGSINTVTNVGVPFIFQRTGSMEDEEELDLESVGRTEDMRGENETGRIIHIHLYMNGKLVECEIEVRIIITIMNVSSHPPPTFVYVHYM